MQFSLAQGYDHLEITCVPEMGRVWHRIAGFQLVYVNARGGRERSWVLT